MSCQKYTCVIKRKKKTVSGIIIPLVMVTCLLLSYLIKSLSSLLNSPTSRRVLFYLFKYFLMDNSRMNTYSYQIYLLILKN